MPPSFSPSFSLSSFSLSSFSPSSVALGQRSILRAVAAAAANPIRIGDTTTTVTTTQEDGGAVSDRVTVRQSDAPQIKE